MRNQNWTTAVLGTVLSCALLLSGCAGGQDVEEPSGTEQMEQTEESVTETTETTEETKIRVLESFTAKTLEEGTFTEDDLAQKDVTVMNFWATFCGPCIVEMPDIAEFAETLPDNVQIVTVCLDGESDLEGVADILDQAGYAGITLLSGDGDFEALCRQVMYTPTTIVVDKDGNMIGDAIIGGQTDLAKSYTDAINKALLSMGKAELGSE
ncbi:MAG: TlpA family protein disulfide reductase [Lachnospiraceae bacterium]|nr:TlpA family protein disulfide reductase [Lachnospiraceae bacterium]